VNQTPINFSDDLVTLTNSPVVADCCQYYNSVSHVIFNSTISSSISCGGQMMPQCVTFL